MPKRLSTALEREVPRLKAKGHGLREIGRMVERSTKTSCFKPLSLAMRKSPLVAS